MDSDVYDSSAGLTIENCSILDWQRVNGLGINFQPNTVATLNIVNSVISGNGNTSSGGGIRVATQAGGFARTHLRNVTIDKNFVGIAAVGSGPNSSVEILGSSISHNRNVGLVAVGTGAAIRFGNSAVIGNAAAATSGNVLSYQNNQIVGNNPDTTPAAVASK